MKTFYYSDITNKSYSTVEALEQAEEKAKKLAIEEQEKKSKRKERAEEVSNSYLHMVEVVKKANKEIKEAEDAFYKLRDSFVKDYGSFYLNFKNGTPVVTTDDSSHIRSFEDFFDTFFRLF